MFNEHEGESWRIVKLCLKLLCLIMKVETSVRKRNGNVLEILPVMLASCRENSRVLQHLKDYEWNLMSHCYRHSILTSILACQAEQSPVPFPYRLYWGPISGPREGEGGALLWRAAAAGVHWLSCHSTLQFAPFCICQLRFHFTHLTKWAWVCSSLCCNKCICL